MYVSCFVIQLEGSLEEFEKSGQSIICWLEYSMKYYLMCLLYIQN